MSFFNSNLDTSIISGRERIMTANAYTDMSIPAFVSVMAKSRAMSVSNPIGMNSDVLNIKVEHVSPMSVPKTEHTHPLRTA